MTMLQQGPYQVQAVVENQPSHREGTADAAILPGTGVVAYVGTDGEWNVRQATSNEDSYRVAIVPGGAKTGPTAGANDDSAASLDSEFASGEHTYTLGFHSGDQARLRLSSNATADPTDTELGWDTDGTVTDDDGAGNGPTTAVARGLERLTRTGADDFVRVEFL